MNPKNLNEIQKSFTTQAQNFEKQGLNMSKQEYLDYTVKSMDLSPDDNVLEAAAGTCICGRAVAPFVKTVTCLDATPAMLAVGKKKAKKCGITNMHFVNGYVENIPFDSQHFDVVFTRLSFHHFTEMDTPFLEMSRVLKSGGQFVIIDLEAAEEALRDIEDKIETMRDPSHIKSRSQDEIIALYERNGYTIIKQEITPLPQPLTPWMKLANTPNDIRKQIENLMVAELNGCQPTGFHAFIKDGVIHFEHRYILFIGVKP